MSQKRVGGIAIVVGFIVLSFITLIGAEEKISPAKQKLVKEVIEITGLNEQTETFISQMHSLLEVFPEDKSENGLTLQKQDFDEMYYAVYDGLFNESELKELVTFLKSSVGEKFLKVRLDLSQAVATEMLRASNVVTILPQLDKERKKAMKEAKKYECMSNLRQIGMALKMYYVDYDEQFPANLEDVYPQYVLDANIFRCPASDNLTYAYVSGLTEAHPGNTIIVYDSSVTNHGNSRNVLFIDGHVKWMGERKFQEALKKSLK